MSRDEAGSTKRRCKVVVIGDASVGKTCLLYAYANPGEFLTEHVPTVFNNFEADITASNGDEKETVSLTLWDTAGQEEYQQLRQMCYGGGAASSPSPTSPSKTDSSNKGKGNKGKGSEGDGRGSGGSSSSAGDDVSVFVVCFSWNNPQSFTNVELKWYREIRQVAAEMMKRSGGGPAAVGAGNSNGNGNERNTYKRPFSVILVATKSDLKNTDYASSKNALKASDAELLRRKIGADAFVECSAKTGEGVRDVFDAALTAWYERHLTEEQKESNREQGKRCVLL